MISFIRLGSFPVSFEEYPDTAGLYKTKIPLWNPLRQRTVQIFLRPGVDALAAPSQFGELD